MFMIGSMQTCTHKRTHISLVCCCFFFEPMVRWWNLNVCVCTKAPRCILFLFDAKSHTWEKKDCHSFSLYNLQYLSLYTCTFREKKAILKLSFSMYWSTNNNQWIHLFDNNFYIFFISFFVIVPLSVLCTKINQKFVYWNVYRVSKTRKPDQFIIFIICFNKLHKMRVLCVHTAFIYVQSHII